MPPANSLLAALPPDTSRDKADVAPYVTPLLSHLASYNAHMDAATAGYQAEAATHAALPKGVSAGLCLLTLLTLGALGLRASRPEAVAALVEMEEKKKEQDAALGEADRQIAEMRQTLENLSTIDALTGLQNHRAFQERLDREMGPRPAPRPAPIFAASLDVDKFKSYNDSYGHHDGDQALKLLADILKGDRAGVRHPRPLRRQRVCADFDRDRHDGRGRPRRASPPGSGLGGRLAAAFNSEHWTGDAERKTSSALPP